MQSNTAQKDLTISNGALTNAVLTAACANAFESILITTASKGSDGYPIIYVNQAFTDMTGHAADEVIGKTPGILQGPKTDRAVIDRLAADLANGRVFQGTAINYRKDGSEFTLEWKVIPVTDDKGTITHFVSVQREVK